jgi:hypothetical protein
MGSEETQSKPKKTGARNLLSTLLFVLAAGLVAIAAYLFIQDWREDDDPPPPPVIAGQAELANVHDVLASEGLDVEYGDDNVRANAFDPAGQQLIVDGESVFVFIFPDPAAREAATEDLDAGELELTYPFGDPVTEEPLSIGQGSNVVTVLVGADEDLQASIDAALATLP